MRYPTVLTTYAEGFTVQFPDIPEALTRGDDRADALKNAADALESALDFYLDEKQAVPLPSRVKRGQDAVELPLTVAAKILLHNEMVTQDVRPAELAKRLHVSRQEMTRLFDRKHPTKIDTAARALKELGKSFELSVR